MHDGRPEAPEAPEIAEAVDSAYIGRLRLQLAPTAHTPAHLDGAWWPRSYGFAVELPPLIRAISTRFGRVRTVLLSPSEWQDAPPAWNAPGRPHTWVSWPADGQRHVASLIRTDGRRLELLVVPVHTELAVADAAMSAALTDGTMTAGQILADAQRHCRRKAARSGAWA